MSDTIYHTTKVGRLVVVVVVVRGDSSLPQGVVEAAAGGWVGRKVKMPEVLNVPSRSA